MPGLADVAAEALQRSGSAGSHLHWRIAVERADPAHHPRCVQD